MKLAFLGPICRSFAVGSEPLGHNQQSVSISAFWTQASAELLTNNGGQRSVVPKEANLLSPTPPDPPTSFCVFSTFPLKCQDIYSAPPPPAPPETDPCFIHFGTYGWGGINMDS